MNIKILDSWLKDYLETSAIPSQIAKYLSLCGPSVERIEKYKKDFVYDIEVTTNRVDTASVYGIAREASTILPKFGIKAKLKNLQLESKNFKFVKSVKYLNAEVNPKLCPRFTTALITGVKIKDSPDWVKDRLESVGIRSINNVVDISNFIMIAFGQPVHTFDYDKIKSHKMILRESKKGEKITTLDDKTFTLKGGDIVIEDSTGRLIDLAGVMGGKLSAIDENTKNVLLFVQTYDPIMIRKTSMELSQRTMAATIFEKGIDPELVSPAMLSAIHLFEYLTEGIPNKDILDIYPNPYKAKKVDTTLNFIVKRLGVTVTKKEITETLNALSFETKWSGDKLEVWIPSFRSNDFGVEEDVLEEIARIYGYHNLPSEIMTGAIPITPPNKQFKFEEKIKNTLAGWDGTEVYTLSLVPEKNGIQLKNPLGSENSYLRTSLMPSLVRAGKENIGTFDKFHLFEMANIYISRKNDIPEEKLILAGIFEGYEYRNAKGILEALFEKLNIDIEFLPEENADFAPGKSLTIKGLGKFGIVEDSNFIYYELGVEKLFAMGMTTKQYVEIPKYPSQIEDITFDLPEKTKIGEVVNSINQLINKVELRDTFKNSFTFRIWYQNANKTLTDGEVAKIRNKIIKEIKNKFGGLVKE